MRAALLRALSSSCRLGAAALTLSTSAALVAAASGSSPPPQWAHPSPYDADAPPGRSADSRHRRAPRGAHDLPALVALWRASPDAETWPWVWCQHNPTGPHHVFVGFSGARTLAAIAGASADAGNNLTVIITPRDDEALARAGVSDAVLHGLRCAIVRSSVAQVDAEARLLMLEDERIVAYDFATFT